MADDWSIRSGASAASGNPESKKSSSMRFRNWMCDCCILAMTASMVCDDWLIVGRTLTTMTWSWMRRSQTSSAVSGAKRISCSKGYCETHERSAPRST